ncbi:MAG: DUF3306 domain-containing protein [Alphaproteobacteria bacterium]
MSADDEPRREAFLSRWSRLKREPVEAKEGSAPASQLDPIDPPVQPLPEGRSLADLIAELPKIQDLVPGQDLSAFMNAWVPQDLRNAALRRMWTMDPAIRDYVSEALDYAYDYNSPATVPGFGLHIPDQGAVQGVARMFEDALDAIADSKRHEHERPVAGSAEASIADGVKNEEIAAAQHNTGTVNVAQVVAATTGYNSSAEGALSMPHDAHLTQNTPSQTQKTHERSGDYDRRPRRNGGALPQV